MSPGLADHDQQHLEADPGKEGMRLVGRHDQHLSGPDRLRGAINRDLGLAIQDMHHRVVGRGMFGQPLPGVK